MCLLVTGDRGDILDLHISRDQNSIVSLTTNPSAIKSSEDPDLHEFIIIAENYEIVDNRVILQSPEKKYWVMEASLEAPSSKDISNPIEVGLTAECNCMGPEGYCIVSVTTPNSSVISLHCNKAPGNPCTGSVTSCKWTFPAVIVTPKNDHQPKTTLIIIESDKILYNGILYE